MVDGLRLLVTEKAVGMCVQAVTAPVVRCPVPPHESQRNNFVLSGAQESQRSVAHGIACEGKCSTS